MPNNSDQQTAGVGWPLELAVFVCGALVMIYEINGSRIVAPYIGTSTYVWTSLIGVILGALSLGYWLGGRSADRSPRPGVLATAIFAAGGLVGLTILIKDPLLLIIGESPIGLELRSIAASTLLFAPASVALGFVIPYATKLRIASLSDAGSTVGRLYALSTVGSIGGTFIAGFVLIPFVGSTRTLYVIALTLFALSIVLVGYRFTRMHFAAMTVLAFGIAANELALYVMRREHNLHDIDTRYSRVRVFDAADPETGRMMRSISSDPVYVQSARYLDGNDLVLDYTPFYYLVSHYRPEPARSLMIGGAGFSFPQAYLDSYPNAFMDVVEIDPGMVRIARDHFGLIDDARLKIVEADGRVFLNGAPTGEYDAVFMDAFGSLFSIPYQLTTIEAVREIRRVVKPDGVVIFNVGSALQGPASLFLQAEFATYRQVFSEIHLYKVRPGVADEDLQNVIMIACPESCPPDLAAAEPISYAGGNSASLLSHRYNSAIEITVPALTDDLAPVERYSSIAHAYRMR